MGVVLERLDDKAFMDEAWGEDSDDAENRNFEVLRAAIDPGLNNGFLI